MIFGTLFGLSAYIKGKWACPVGPFKPSVRVGSCGDHLLSWRSTCGPKGKSQWLSIPEILGKGVIWPSLSLHCMAQKYPYEGLTLNAVLSLDNSIFFLILMQRPTKCVNNTPQPSVMDVRTLKWKQSITSRDLWTHLWNFPKSWRKVIFVFISASA